MNEKMIANHFHSNFYGKSLKFYYAIKIVLKTQTKIKTKNQNKKITKKIMCFSIILIYFFGHQTKVYQETQPQNQLLMRHDAHYHRKIPCLEQ